MIPPVGKEFQGGGQLAKDGLGRGLTFNQTFFGDNRISTPCWTFSHRPLSLEALMKANKRRDIESSDYCDESYLIWPLNYHFQVNWMTSWLLPRHFFTGYLSIPPVGTGLNVNTAAFKKGGNYIFGFMSGMARGFTSTLFYPHITSWVAVEEEAAGRWTLFPFPLYRHHHARLSCRLGWTSSL